MKFLSKIVNIQLIKNVNKFTKLLTQDNKNCNFKQVDKTLNKQQNEKYQALDLYKYYYDHDILEPFVYLVQNCLSILSTHHSCFFTIIHFFHFPVSYNRFSK